MNARLFARLGLAATLAAGAALGWAGYQRPDFVLWLGNSLLLCT